MPAKGFKVTFTRVFVALTVLSCLFVPALVIVWALPWALLFIFDVYAPWYARQVEKQLQLDPARLMPDEESIMVVRRWIGRPDWRWTKLSRTTQWAGEYFELTNKRILLHTGVKGWQREEHSVRLEQILDVTVNQDFAGQANGYGDLIIQTAATGKAEYVLKKAEHAYEMRNAILAAQDATMRRAA